MSIGKTTGESALRHLVVVAVAVLFVGVWQLNSTHPGEAHTSVDMQFVANHTGKCMDASYASAPYFHEWNCHNGDNQRFDFVHKSDGYHEIRVRHTNACLGIQGASTANGALMKQSTCTGAADQRFLVPSDGTWGEIRMKHSNKCLDVKLSSPNAGFIHQWSCHGGDNQKWLVRLPVQVQTWLYEPTGNSSGAAWLNCGWHENCVDGENDPGEGLVATDWGWQGAGPTAYLRLKAVDLGIASGMNVAKAYISRYTDNPYCYASQVQLKDWYGSEIAWVDYWHTDRSSISVVRDIKSSTSGYYNEWYVGTAVPSEKTQDCGWTGPHVHHHFRNTVAFSLLKNSGIPDEEDCNGSSCSIYRAGPEWTRYLWRFSFNRTY